MSNRKLSDLGKMKPNYLIFLQFANFWINFLFYIRFNWILNIPSRNNQEDNRIPKAPFDEGID